jgi:hypothetical protein
MKTGSLIFKYFKALWKQWYSTVIAILEFLGFLLLTFKGIYIPAWVYLLIYGLVFLFANFIIYRDNQIKFKGLKEQSQKESDELRQRIAELEYAYPQLDLFFKVGNELAKSQTIVVEDPPKEVDIDNLVSIEKQKLADSYSQKETRESVRGGIAKEMIPKILMGVKKSPEEYDDECKSYLKKFKDYLVSKQFYDLYKARYRYAHFAVKNTGKVPGEDIILVAHFPDVFNFLIRDDWEDIIARIEPPSAPERPMIMKSTFDNLMNYRISSLPNLYPILPKDISNLGPRNVRGPFISPKKSTEVKYEIESLLHNFTEEKLDEIGFFVTDDAIGHSWNVEYEIHAANLPEPIKGPLGIIVERQRAPEKITSN